MVIIETSGPRNYTIRSTKKRLSACATTYDSALKKAQVMLEATRDRTVVVRGKLRYISAAQRARLEKKRAKERLANLKRAQRARRKKKR
jgi:hypothetical protein